MCPTTAATEAAPHPDFSLVFPPDPGWVRTAREAVRTALTSAHRTELTDDALLLTSEAVTNAVNACLLSGCSAPVTLYADWTPAGSFRVLVCDDAPGGPTVSRPYRRGGDDEHGRGLFLISECAAEWGVCRHGPGPGKAIWFRLGARVRA
ncbi:ATP-binding protein [Streptomyces zagrosensis]|uniref:Anti-sigma regulatory factor (Ser/Thr protein kinase) n=1 Tax=Streptomyces zagrosensis TaxID=1042984 RepID=A0A7W9V011_9ACTN|nr:ATP-binding protein [Streptomyces zagrosensis]MBB5936856.1 anti-sigma regulatory factor (Ser/Thr protein kinase) [Streptomyces zagrosensis]